MHTGPLYSGENAPLQRKDPRIRGVPFVTRRPTFAETRRVLAHLLTVFAVTLLEAAPAPDRCSGVLSCLRSGGCERHCGAAELPGALEGRAAMFVCDAVSIVHVCLKQRCPLSETDVRDLATVLKLLNTATHS